MTTTDSSNAIAALSKTDHAYLAIRPADATPAEAPGFLLAARSINAFNYSLQDAGKFWPDCHAWSLIGSDELLIQQGTDWPAGMNALRTPAQLATFTTR
jgi:hypothetical protein